jgi:hypothetical protein
MSSVPFFVILLLGVLAYALAKGGGPERAVAVAYIVASAGSLSLSFFEMAGRFQVVPLHIFVTDILLLVALSYLAVRANRWWLIPVAGCQLVATLVHAGKLVNPDMIPNSYAFLMTIWSWPMVALLGLGTWAHRRRLADGIIVPDWKPSSARRRSAIRSGPQPG